MKEEKKNTIKFKKRMTSGTEKKQDVKKYHTSGEIENILKEMGVSPVLLLYVQRNPKQMRVIFDEAILRESGGKEELIKALLAWSEVAGLREELKENFNMDFIKK